MQAEKREPEVMETRFSSPGMLDADEWEPDPASWNVGSGSLPDTLDDEAARLEFDIPTDEGPSLSTEPWNIGRALALAAAFVPVLLGAEPALAAPPSAETVAPPIENSPPSGDKSAIWAALTDRHVILTRTDGATFNGTVLSVTDDGLVCAHDGDGLVVVVAIDEISFVQVLDLEDDDDEKKPSQPGQGLIVLGSIATAIGGSLTIAAAAIGATCASNSYYDYVYVCPYLTAPLGAVGLANLAAGIPMLAVGLRRRAAARAATQPTMSAFMAPGRHGAMAGVGIRF